MIAIPVKERGEEPIVSEVFAMSKWFLIIDEDIVTFEKNIYKSGVEVILWLQQMGIKQIVAHKMGSTTYEKLKALDILCLYTNMEVKVTDIMEQVKNSQLSRLNEQTSVFQKSCITNP